MENRGDGMRQEREECIQEKWQHMGLEREKGRWPPRTETEREGRWGMRWGTRGANILL